MRQTRELFYLERGKTSSKKLNMGDTYSAKIETSVILQQHLLDADQRTCIDPESTMLYGNVKAVVPLVRERLGVELDSEYRPKYRRSELVPLRESMAFGIVTKD